PCIVTPFPYTTLFRSESPWVARKTSWTSPLAVHRTRLGTAYWYGMARAKASAEVDSGVMLVRRGNTPESPGSNRRITQLKDFISTAMTSRRAIRELVWLACTTSTLPGKTRLLAQRFLRPSPTRASYLIATG